MYAFGKNKENIPLSVIEYAKSLGKREYVYIKENENTYILAGTPLAIEDVIETKLFEVMKSLSTVFTNSVTEQPNVDEMSNLRDLFIQAWINANNITIIYDSIEF